MARNRYPGLKVSLRLVGIGLEDCKLHNELHLMRLLFSEGHGGRRGGIRRGGIRRGLGGLLGFVGQRLECVLCDIRLVGEGASHILILNGSLVDACRLVLDHAGKAERRDQALRLAAVEKQVAAEVAASRAQEPGGKLARLLL